MSTHYDYRIRWLFSRFDWRVKWKLALPVYGVWRYIRIGKLGIQLWKVR